jgi:hypothetical protein
VAIARTSLVVVVVRFLRIPAPKLRVEHMAYGLLASGIYLTFKIRSFILKKIRTLNLGGKICTFGPNEKIYIFMSREKNMHFRYY